MIQFSLPVGLVPRAHVAFVAATSVLFAGVSYAQHDHAVPTPLALSPVPLVFDSVLSRYKPMADQKLGSWREANDTVTRIGGWRAYLKEAQTLDAVVPSVSSNPAAPAPVAPVKGNPHAGHGAKP
jgi:hypothetical protein